MGKIILVREDDKKLNRLNRAYGVVTQMAIKYGSTYKRVNEKYVCRYTERNIREFWNYDEPAPPAFYFQKNTNIKTIRKIIQARVEISNKIWNPDFINGLCCNGEIKDGSEINYKSFTWSNNINIYRILEGCPYGGDLRNDKWSNVPILDVRYNQDSFSYFAGVFMGGELTTKNYKQYAVYRDKSKNEILKLNIPIEYESQNMIMISPFWPSLFSPFMPKGRHKNKWKNSKNPVRGELYSTVLWKSYMNNEFPTKGLPFLKSRRSIYYKYKCKEGAMKKIESLRISTGLVEINYIFRDIVKYWGGNT